MIFLSQKLCIFNYSMVTAQVTTIKASLAEEFECLT